MGRQAYLTRLALGRSAYEPPEDSDNFNASRAGEWTSALAPPGQTFEEVATVENSAIVDFDPPQGVQLYNARGHPFNPWARARGRQLREAMNDVLSEVGVVERNAPESSLGSNSLLNQASEDENLMGEQIGYAADVDNYLLTWWIHAFTNRLLAFPPPTGVSFTDILRTHYKTLGPVSFFFAGLPSFLFCILINPELWTQQIMYQIDRTVIASIVSRRRRELYMRLRSYVLGSIGVLLTTLVFPFQLHSMLQILGFIPASKLLPSFRSWIPFCGTSVIQWNHDHLPILPFFAYRTISSFLHHYTYLSIRPAIMEPANSAHRRRSSGSRFATSINSANLMELPNVETALTNVFRKVFGFIGWGQPSHVSDMSPQGPFTPSLRRRETWRMEIDEGAPMSGTINEDTAVAPNTPTAQPRNQSGTERTEEGRPPLQQSPSPSHDNDADADIREPESISDATIRVSSIDPESGTVNLEIGLPDIPEDQRATFVEQQAGNLQRVQRSRGDSASAAPALFQRPHRVSRLALEPTEMLASLTNGVVAGWLLIPLRGYVLLRLARYVAVRPGIFGVDKIRAKNLPLALAGPGLFAGHQWHGVDGYGGKVALSCAVDMALGLGLWLTESVIVRMAGTNLFNWGRL